MILAWVQSWNIFETLMKVWSPPEFFHKNMSHEQLLFTWSTFRDSSMVTKLKCFLKLMKVCRPPEFFHKKCLAKNYFSHDPHFVILAWVQSWNIYEKHMKLWFPPDVFHKNMSHEQLPCWWSTIRYSSMGAKLKYFLKNSWKHVVHLNVFTKTCLTINNFSSDPHFVILAWVQSWNIYEKHMKVCSPSEFFHKSMSHEQ